MKATADANILFASLITDGLTRKIWFNEEIELYCPAFIIIEFLKYKNLIEKKFKGPKDRFESLLDHCLKQTIIVKNEELEPYIPAADTLVEDRKDLVYFACALKENTILWSNDKEWKNQTRIAVKTTEELAEEFKS